MDENDTPSTRRAALAERLRNPPRGRPEWDFADASRCAFHDLKALWPDREAEWNRDTDAFLGVNADAVLGIIQDDARGLYGVRPGAVTPEMVARELETYSG